MAQWGENPLNIYEARWEYAQTVVQAYNDAIKQGYIVRDSYGQIVSKIVIDENQIYYPLGNSRFILFVNSKDEDAGLYDTKEEWAKIFEDWSVSKPLKLNIHK